MRLVLAHVVRGPYAQDAYGDGEDGIGVKARRIRAERLLARVAEEYGVTETAERRVAVGDPPTALGEIAADETADVILVGSRARGRRARGIESTLAAELKASTAVPVVIAPPSSLRPARPLARAAFG
jgi:nucleotide-binding universal stress UspA family protein